MAPDASKIEAMGEEQSTITREGGCLTFIDFSKLGDKGSCLGYGWSGQEETFIWMVGTRSELSVSPTSFSRDHWLQIMLDPYICPPYCRGQPIHVWVNGHSVGAAFVEQRCCLTVRIRAEQLSVGEPIKIVMKHSGFAVPAALEQKSDNRPLALRVFGVWLWTDGLLDATPFRPDLGPKPPTLNLTPVEHNPLEATRAGGVEAYTFGASGSIQPYLSDGWHAGEDGFAWTSKKTAKIDLPAPKIALPLLMKIVVHPPDNHDNAIPQRLTVTSNGEVLGQFRVSAFNRYEALSMPIPARCLKGKLRFELEFHVPDAIRPKDVGHSGDNRLLGLCFHRLDMETIKGDDAFPAAVRYPDLAYSLPTAGRSDHFVGTPNDRLAEVISNELQMPVSEMLKRSESLGDNCEFGTVQRKMGVEVLGLLRFANVSLENLIEALSDEFISAVDAPSLTFSLERDQNREFLMSVSRYNIHWHTFVFENISDQEKSQQAAKLSYLRRRFYEGLAAGRKLYVLKDPEHSNLDRFIPVFLALNRYGRNALLIVSPATGGVRAGVVDLIGPGLMRGYIDKFAPNGANADPYAWLPVLANAWMLAGINGTA